MKIETEFNLLDDILLAIEKQRDVSAAIHEASVSGICPVTEFEISTSSRPSAIAEYAISSASLDWIRTGLGERSVREPAPNFRAQSRELSKAPRSKEYAATDDWLTFCKRFDKSAQETGCSFEQALTLAAAMRELASNIHDHSDAEATAFVAYEAVGQQFSFVVADQGIGVLKSLRSSSRYEHLANARDGLAALLQGASRHGQGHGNGYREVFRVLDRCAGYVRCRSGDAVLTWRTGAQPVVLRRPDYPGLSVTVAVEI